MVSGCICRFYAFEGGTDRENRFLRELEEGGGGGLRMAGGAGSGGGGGAIVGGMADLPSNISEKVRTTLYNRG